MIKTNVKLYWNAKGLSNLTIKNTGHVTLIEKRLDAQRTKQMHNINIQAFTSAGTIGVSSKYNQLLFF